MARAFYSRSISEFLVDDPLMILGCMADKNPFDLNDLQKHAWVEEISILKQQLKGFEQGRILFEYTIPRMGKRVDVVLLLSGIVFIFEFKVGESEYKGNALKQVLDYALDLKNFQSTCKDLLLAPVFIPTEAPNASFTYDEYEDHILHPIGISKGQINSYLRATIESFPRDCFDYEAWEKGEYKPSPTIIEAAQALYSNHSVSEISRSDAGAQNLTITTATIKEIIKHSKENSKKSIIFVTGVPGAGKTLVGLNLASEFHNNERCEHAVFLSGNGPLVEVLQEALSRDKIRRDFEKGIKTRKEDARREIESFIQIIHHYRDEYVGNSIAPTEHVAIFDESQRAWTKDEISSFMQKKKGILNFEFSEPEFLISTMDRLPDWGVIVCLIGGGQEINRGEAGMPEWFDSLKRSFPDWDIYSSDNIQETEYIRDREWSDLTEGLNLHIDKSLHLASSMRSYRSEKVAAFIKLLLDNDAEEAKKIFIEIAPHYPIVLTRDLAKAKKWVKEKARGSERYGLLASSSAARLKPCGVVYAKDRSAIAPKHWFLNQEEDIRSSLFLEAVASEFETQGLELDYSIVAWDADFRIRNHRWVPHQMSTRLNPPNWSEIHSEDNRLFMKNAYRVLLTRSRQGFAIFLPNGNRDDPTRDPRFYDETYNYLKEIGIPEL